MSSTDILDITKTLKLYFDGLYTCDVKTLSQAFHPKAIYATADENPFMHRTMDEYFDVISKRKSPASNNEKRDERILSIDIAGNATAAVKVSCTFGGRDFIDFLTFVKVDNDWLIISKVFHFTQRDTE